MASIAKKENANEMAEVTAVNNPRLDDVAASKGKEVHENKGEEESIESVYDWMVSEKQAIKQRKWEQVKDEEARLREERKKYKQFVREFGPFRKQRRKKHKLEVYSYDQVRLAFSSEDL